MTRDIFGSYNVCMVRFTLNIDPQDLAYMRSIVKDNLSEFIRKAIKKALEKHVSTGAFSPSKKVGVKNE